LHDRAWSGCGTRVVVVGVALVCSKTAFFCFVYTPRLVMWTPPVGAVVNLLGLVLVFDLWKFGFPCLAVRVVIGFILAIVVVAFATFVVFTFPTA
jgi:hypothetical protein